MSTFKKSAAFILSVTLALTAQSAVAAGLGTKIAVRLVGTGDLFIGDELFADFGLAPEGALCYDLDLVDVKTGDVIGSATDCLTNISGVGDGVALTGTTFFFFPGGTVVSMSTRQSGRMMFWWIRSVSRSSSFGTLKEAALKVMIMRRRAMSSWTSPT